MPVHLIVCRKVNQITRLKFIIHNTNLRLWKVSSTKLLLLFVNPFVNNQDMRVSNLKTSFVAHHFYQHIWWQVTELVQTHQSPSKSVDIWMRYYMTTTRQPLFCSDYPLVDSHYVGDYCRLVSEYMLCTCWSVGFFYCCSLVHCVKWNIMFHVLCFNSYSYFYQGMNFAQVWKQTRWVRFQSKST
jgi:hypothetical protein